MFRFRQVQERVMDEAFPVLEEQGFVYLSLEVRTGKTHTALGLCERLGARHVLFVTTKKTLDSQTIQHDHRDQENTFDLTVINYESVHKIDPADVDVLVLDEAHLLGAFPKPSKRGRFCKELKQRIPHTILLSGTPTPESFSQMFHQFWGLPNSPFSHSTFYQFARDHVDVQQKRVGTGQLINDYSRGRDSILEAARPVMVSATQQEAGFVSSVNEHIHTVPVDQRLHRIIETVQREKVFEVDEDRVILADSGAKEMSKIHQLCSGTVKFENGDSVVADLSKARYIRKTWAGQKIVIFYKFVAELAAIQRIYGDDVTTNLNEFFESDKSLAIQIVAGRSGISLRQATTLVFYNIDFSATSYWQARDRLTTKERMDNDIHWIFSDVGLEQEIYETVLGKRNFTLSHYRDWNEESA